MTVLDLSGIPPVFVREPLDLSSVTVKDDGNGPSFIVVGSSLKVKEVLRPVGKEYGEGAPGIGIYLPIQFSTSHKDWDESAIVALGSCEVIAESITSNVCVNVLPNVDGSYGQGSVVKIGKVSGFRFGVLASGQATFRCEIGESEATLYDDEPAGHCVYANRCTKDGKQLGLRGAYVRIGKSRAYGVQGKDSVTAKFKSTWELDYACLDDKNPCGALDAFDCSGTAKIAWWHPGGLGTPYNPVFGAFRVSSHPENPPANGKLSLSGTFDNSLGNQTVFGWMWQTKLATFSTCIVKGGGKGDVYWYADPTGVQLLPKEIER